MKNPERGDRVRSALRENKWDLIVCALPKNVLLLTGYWPVIGAGIAIGSAEGKISLIVPEDEKDLAKRGWANDIWTFEPGSVNELTTTARAIQSPLRKLAASFSAQPVRVGFEAHETSEPSSYSAMHLYSGTMRTILEETLSIRTLTSADEILAELCARKTNFEIEQIRTACCIAEQAFHRGFEQIKSGTSEVETAARFREPLSTSLVKFPELSRTDGFAWCMSGANSALASGAYARSRAKRIEWGDLLLVHMNSYADGYWTDVMRTYSVGKLDERRMEMYDAVFAARKAALGAIRPGANGADVDAAARNVLEARGFGPQFKHSTGHGVGFSAINANAKPRLHLKSDDRMEAGMVLTSNPPSISRVMAGSDTATW
ncbi:MAG: Xaa-Pro peptidase family protein [Candidatus Binataceae bacterium]